MSVEIAKGITYSINCSVTCCYKMSLHRLQVSSSLPMSFLHANDMLHCIVVDSLGWFISWTQFNVVVQLSASICPRVTWWWAGICWEPAAAALGPSSTTTRRCLDVERMPSSKQDHLPCSWLLVIVCPSLDILLTVCFILVRPFSTVTVQIMPFNCTVVHYVNMQASLCMSLTV